MTPTCKKDNSSVPVYIADHAHKVKTFMAVASVIKTQVMTLFTQLKILYDSIFFFLATL
ncbi:hypothetical protein NBO_362g0008 [Nosema bombycis CQ1]|uniref:Uncharacterized protein n=1 Tax=Nosema bombycis (strain CQ1 / CVCC 102059) TaxID=578461 RepID=R0MJ67_NOSB1|nr:hypothetical protein NBO_362g0008 [Nosema bombycis CQ1]|eukprot:EOB12823.1 hypothetical protein NBO_362g0008 [Nosema bombycis CQ1]